MGAASRFTLYDRTGYFADLTLRLDSLGRGDRADLATMSFDAANPALRPLIESLQAAAARGVRVQFLVDAFNFLKADDGSFGPLFYGTKLIPETLRGPYAKQFAVLETLREAGVAVTVLNRPRRRFSLPFAGRSHMKFAILNDRLYLGGCNLDYPTHADAMIAWHDQAAADWLHQQATALCSAGTVTKALGDFDLYQQLSPTESIIIDVGKRGQSAILDEAIGLIDQARKHLYLTSQYFPSSATGKHIHAAMKRGVKVELLYNHVSNAFPPRLPLKLNVWVQKHRLPEQMFENELPRDHPYLHAKILATEQGMLFGSHNYVKPGVTLGTAEIALLSREPATAKALVTTFQKHVLAVS